MKEFSSVWLYNYVYNTISELVLLELLALRGVTDCIVAKTHWENQPRLAKEMTQDKDTMVGRRRNRLMERGLQLIHLKRIEFN